ncbi:unnamed protein product [Tuber aestivum]|uniref:Uncharacterized protein n=1 Tax=Tuber aestivum TaxID=59557 RepID=A0A292Q6P9_9PEZI|nr:unnamed protein product [Tuber aestivum]
MLRPSEKSDCLAPQPVHPHPLRCAPLFMGAGHGYNLSNPEQKQEGSVTEEVGQQQIPGDNSHLVNSGGLHDRVMAFGTELTKFTQIYGEAIGDLSSRMETNTAENHEKLQSGLQALESDILVKYWGLKSDVTMVKLDMLAKYLELKAEIRNSGSDMGEKYSDIKAQLDVLWMFFGCVLVCVLVWFFVR